MRFEMVGAGEKFVLTPSNEQEARDLRGVDTITLHRVEKEDGTLMGFSYDPRDMSVFGGKKPEPTPPPDPIVEEDPLEE